MGLFHGFEEETEGLFIKSEDVPPKKEDNIALQKKKKKTLKNINKAIQIKLNIKCKM